MSLYTSFNYNIEGTFKGVFKMTSREQFENDYLLNDEKYLYYYCDNEAEKLEIERELRYDNDTWLFNKPNYGLEDDYSEDSLP